LKQTKYFRRVSTLVAEYDILSRQHLTGPERAALDAARQELNGGCAGTASIWELLGPIDITGWVPPRGAFCLPDGAGQYLPD
jgi:hypothetical protein